MRYARENPEDFEDRFEQMIDDADIMRKEKREETPMKTKHAPEPWKITSSWNDFTIEGPSNEEIIFQDGPHGTPTIKSANAERIVACVNACKGIEDPTAFISEVKAMIDQARSVKGAWEDLPLTIRAHFDRLYRNGGKL